MCDQQRVGARQFRQNWINRPFDQHESAPLGRRCIAKPRIRGCRNIHASRASQPNVKRFTVRRILGGGDFWITEFVFTYL
jgi:hypothetical protein